ncbi:MAG: amidohydrolase family protein [Rhodothermales bacterium]
MSRLLFAVLCLLIASCTRAPDYDLIIRGGTLYDGSGAPPVVGDLALNADTIAAIGNLGAAGSRVEIDATGLAVAPGFINMLSWATESLIFDGRSQSDIRQGVTLEVFGEGWSMGPLNEEMKQNELRQFEARLGSKEAVAEALGIPYDDETPLTLPWTTLNEYLEFLETRGIAPNVASFVGATTVRIHELGYAQRAPSPDERARMQTLVRRAMEEGALGVGSSLIYAPAFYADTDELIALSEVAAAYDGRYISHMRSEGNRLLESVDELITIAREAGIAAEIYHLKAAGRENWDKLDAVIDRVEAARAEGLDVTADMYTYTAGATGLNASMPPSIQEGGFEAWRTRLQDPAIRARLEHEMTTPTDAWENLFLAAGAENVLLVGFRNEALRPLTGKTLAEVAAERGTSAAVAAMDLVVEDSSRVETVYFLMSEENVRRQIAVPWVSFASDAGSLAPEGVFLQSNPHPRAYGNFARLLGTYVRDEQVIPLEEAVRRLTALPAANLKLRKRGALQPGYFADVAIFDPVSIQDHATFEAPHQYATGMIHVFVNGTHVLRDGEHTGATPGRVVRGPGWKGRQTDAATN